MICLQCGQPCKKTDKFCYRCGAGLESLVYDTGQHAGGGAKMKMSRLSYLLALGISLTLANIAYTAVSVSLIVIYLTAGLAGLILTLPIIVAAAAEGVLLLFAAVMTLVFIHRMWASIQGGPARMTPGQAVGYLFIPFFNIYWIFQVFWGFARDYNTMLDRRDMNAAPLPEGIFLAVPIITLTVWIPGLGPITGIVGSVLLLLIVARVCERVNALGTAADDADLPVQEDLPAAAGYGEVSHREEAVPPVSAASYPPTRSPVTKQSLEAGKIGWGLRPALVGVTGQYANKVFDLGHSRVIIGRDPKMAHLVYSSNNEGISRKHCSVRFDEGTGKFVLEDYSLNGTYLIPHVRLDQGRPVYLNPGERFYLSEMQELYEVRLE